MNCPECSSKSFVPGRRCDQCGYQDAPGEAPAKSTAARARRSGAKDAANLSFDFAQDAASDHDNADWRDKLKKKLALVQENKARPGPDARSRKPVPEPQQARGVKAAPEIRRRFVDPQPIKKPDYDIHRNLRDFQASIQKLPPTHASPKTRSVRAAQRELPRAPLSQTHQAAAAVRPMPAAAEPEWIAYKGILMTRTLSGLIDLCCVFVCVTLFLMVSLRWGAVDVLSQAFRPILWGSAIFFQVFYSIYFLGLTQRTVGMMLTGLRVTDEQSGKPGFQQILSRTLFFFFSGGLVFFGLCWGIWDKRSRCLHDLLSHTIVVRC